MKNKRGSGVLTSVLIFLSAVYIAPVVIIFINSFKSRLYISSEPFSLPTSNTFAGISNYLRGLSDTGFLSAFLWSAFITVFSVGAIVFFTSMTAWFLVRVKNRITKAIYYGFLFSMIVPFQMVMFTMSKIANTLNLDNPVGIILLYLGFGAGLSVFIFSGFIRSLPVSLEEAATIDGCGPVRTFFWVVLPLLRPTAITVAILQTMWIWNDYLLPYLVIGNDYKTIPIAIQYLKGGYGSIDMGALMAMLVLAVVPVVIFYLLCQKYIIKGVAAGAVKG